MKNVILCSSYPVLTEGFRMVLEQCGEFRVFACSNAAEIPDLPGISPDIIMIDAGLGVSLGTLGELRTMAPGAAVILWIDRISPEFAAQALGLGVMGILDKTSSIEHHLHCISRAAAGELCVEADLYVRLLRHKPVKLTPRESQLTSLLAQGLKNKELAHQLGITEGTVKVYLSKLFEKTGANDRFELALFALKNLGIDHAYTPDRKSSPSDLSLAPVFLPEFLATEGIAA